MREFTEQELVRREKAEKLRELGLDPFGQRFDRKDFAADIKEKYIDVEHDAFENMEDTATVAGRIMFIRRMGKASKPSKCWCKSLNEYQFLIRSYSIYSLP